MHHQEALPLLTALASCDNRDATRRGGVPITRIQDAAWTQRHSGHASLHQAVARHSEECVT
jgi:hypothetical protein